MEKLIRRIDKLSHFSAIISGFLIIIAMSLILVEVFLRTLFTSTCYVCDEYTGYFMAVLTFLSFAYTLKEKEHVRMTLGLTLLTEKQRDFVDMWCLLVALVFGVLLVYGTSVFFWDSVTMRSQAMSISETYLAIPQVFLPLGSAIFTLQVFSELYKTYGRWRNHPLLEKNEEVTRSK